MTELDRIFQNSEKGDLIEALKEVLQDGDPKVVIAWVKDDEDQGGFRSQVFQFGTSSTYEALGVIEIARQRIYDNDFLERQS